MDYSLFVIALQMNRRDSTQCSLTCSHPNF